MCPILIKGYVSMKSWQKKLTPCQNLPNEKLKKGDYFCIEPSTKQDQNETNSKLYNSFTCDLQYDHSINSILSSVLSVWLVWSQNKLFY